MARQAEWLNEADRIVERGFGMVEEAPQMPVDDALIVLLSNVTMSDGEVRLLSYQALGGSLDMSIADIATLFGWSERKAYYVLGALETKGLLRRETRGRRQ